MKKSSVILGKAVRIASRLKGGGSALPGLIVEKYDKNFLNDVLSKLPDGIIVISGTNGKTTTTKMVAELLESLGLKVFTNKTGSNFVRGVISEIIGNIKKFKFDYDIAVIELDEAHAIKFIEQVKPDYTLLLNVLRDQLDRFGEIDTTAKLLTEIAKNTKKTVILNQEDPLVSSIAFSLPSSKKVVYFGYSKELASFFPNDEELHNGKIIPLKSTKKPFVELHSFSKNKVTYIIKQKSYSTKMSLTGVYNYFNAAGALATVLSIYRDADIKQLMNSLGEVSAAFGRGEVLNINGVQVELILVKNPSGFTSSLKSQYDPKADMMIAVNDHYADGRDMSWLWDVDFSDINNVSVISGVRAYDMALRLQYNGVKFKNVNTNIKKSVSALFDSKNKKQIFATYTAMLEIRKILGKMDEVKDIL